nr:MAG TPA: hypothetical protein [Bacteriophage sp.]
MKDSPIYMLRSVYSEIKYADLGKNGYLGNVNEKDEGLTNIHA